MRHGVPPFLAFLEEKVVIPFIERTWFLWWILAILVILRWFHLFSSGTEDSAIEVCLPKEGQAGTAPEQTPSATARRLFT
jgi:hypothetical protein